MMPILMSGPQWQECNFRRHTAGFASGDCPKTGPKGKPPVSNYEPAGLIDSHDVEAMTGLYQLPQQQLLEGWDEHPVGFVIFTKDGRMLALLTAGDRIASATADQLIRSMCAYSGRYRVEDHKRMGCIGRLLQPQCIGLALGTRGRRSHRGRGAGPEFRGELVADDAR